MPEPTTAAGAVAAFTGAVTGVTLGTMWPQQPDIALVSGALCGSLVFLLRSKEPSRWKRGIYFLVSFFGGYFVAPHLRAQLAWLPIWPAAFVTSAALVAASAIALDVMEARLPGVLEKVFDLPGVLGSLSKVLAHLSKGNRDE